MQNFITKLYANLVASRQQPRCSSKHQFHPRWIYTSKAHAVVNLVVMICIIGISGLALAAGGEDLLKGTDASLIATLSGSGKRYIYLAEGFLSLAMYIKTKNLLVLFGIIIVAVFFNIILKVAGVA